MVNSDGYTIMFWSTLKPSIGRLSTNNTILKRSYDFNILSKDMFQRIIAQTAATPVFGFAQIEQ